MRKPAEPFEGRAHSRRRELGRASCAAARFNWRLAASVRAKYGAPSSKIRQAGCKTHATLRKEITAFLKPLPDDSTEGDEVFPNLDWHVMLFIVGPSVDFNEIATWL
jgi:hypothetical protein